MTRRKLLAAALLVAAGLALAGCGGASEGDEAVQPAKVEPVGNGLTSVVLTANAARRLGVQTATVSNVWVDGRLRKVIPYTAVLYETEGGTWTYTSPKPLVYVREEILVARVDRGLAILSEGPSFGTRVVTVGSAELWGVEYGEIEED
jgi:hypothetical protein